MFHFAAYTFGAYTFRSATFTNASYHDVFAQEPPPQRINRVPEDKDFLRDLTEAVRELERRLAAEREEAIQSGAIAQEEFARWLLNEQQAKERFHAAMLARKDDEDAIAMLMMYQ